METSKASRISWKHIVCCFVLLVIFVLTVGVHTNAETVTESAIAEADAEEVVPLNSRLRNIFLIGTQQNEVELAGPKEEVSVERSDLDIYITIYKEDIELLSKAFGVDKDEVVADLYSRYETYDEFENTNVGHLLNADGEVKTFRNDLYGLVEYFYDYVEKNPKKVNKKRVPYEGNSEYVEKLIIYFTENIYTNVDTTTALSIGAAESGYYKVKGMLRSNNIYGGMSSQGLIKYRNIEYGVLSYIRLLSTKYYAKGLNTVESIGRVYCPTYDSNGYKIASPHWINLVKTAKNKYSKYNFDIHAYDIAKV